MSKLTNCIIGSAVGLFAIYMGVNYSNKHNKISYEESEKGVKMTTFAKLDLEKFLFSGTSISFAENGRVIVFSPKMAYMEGTGDSVIDHVEYYPKSVPDTYEGFQNVLTKDYKLTIKRFGSLIQEEFSQEELKEIYPFVYRTLNKGKH